MSETQTQKSKRYTTINYPEFDLASAEKELDQNEDLWLKYRMGIELAELMNEGGCLFFCWRKLGRVRLNRIAEMFSKLRDVQGNTTQDKEPFKW